MKFNYNEKKYVEEMINNNVILNKRYPKNDIRLLIRYFYSIGVDPELIVFNVTNFMNIISENKKDWSSDVKKCYKELLNKSFLTKKLSNVEFITITKKEMDQIESLKNDNLEKVAFGLLVYCKIWREINQNDSCWVRIDNTTDFYRDIQVSVCAKDREMNIHKLLVNGLISIPRKTASTDIKLEFIDCDSEVVITIYDIKNFIFDYYIYKGKKVISCQECGCKVLSKSKTKPEKYCRPCVKDKQKQWEKRSRLNKKQ